MHPTVRPRFLAMSKDLEGDLSHMYLDVERLVTIGVGLLIDPESSLAGLTFTRLSGGIASASEVSNAWSVVKHDRTLDPARGGAQYAALTTVRATPESLARLMDKRLDRFDGEMALVFPEWEAWPDEAQTATLSMAYAMGGLFWLKFPKFVAACKAQDWSGAADECHMGARVMNASAEKRNALNRALFLAAAIKTYVEPEDPNEPKEPDEPPEVA
jgi:GH24 family phage-related lysozyme (muramidase)